MQSPTKPSTRPSRGGTREGREGASTFQIVCLAVGLLSFTVSYFTTPSREGLADSPLATLSTEGTQEDEEDSQELAVTDPISPAEAAELGIEGAQWLGIIVHHTVVETSVDNLVKSHRDRGLGGLAYHFLILGPETGCDGCVVASRRWLEQIPVPQTTNSVVNDRTIAVAMVGDTTADSPSGPQMSTLAALISLLSNRFGLNSGDIHGHGEVAPSECPGGYLMDWVKSFRSGA